jgi:hypothetical protein
MLGMERKPNWPLIAAIGVAHLGIATLTWRDIRNRPADQIRGSKRAWRILSALNSGNSLVYWVIGRRRAPAAGK